VKTLAAVIKMLWNGECKYISSKFLKSVIGQQDNLFCGMDQQDSHEFLVMLIDWLQSDLQTISMVCLANTSRPLNLDPFVVLLCLQSNYVDNLPASEKAWLEFTKAKESFILRLFYGQIKSTVKCTICGEESATFDTFSNLSLELPMCNVDRYDITECFNLYFHGERISGWNCPRCKVPREAIKKLDISKLPPVLVIHMKRFHADGYSFRKKQALVDFPLTDLNMLQYVSPKERIHLANTNYRYNLYAVSNHYGTMESGHYTGEQRD
jgi:ubiquitin carboxyl-terminal hydrolase 8